TTGIFGFPTGCLAFADDEFSGKLVFSGARRVSIGLSKPSSIHLSVKYLWLRVGNWAPLCFATRRGDRFRRRRCDTLSIGNRSGGTGLSQRQTANDVTIAAMPVAVIFVSL
ncbi:hypothetical protein, partial [Rhizobium sp.]|uniref:hypothetical protein n=1 Tax=Rhizobium sp. TaxID=391 RepID=UPI003981D32A